MKNRSINAGLKTLVIAVMMGTVMNSQTYVINTEKSTLTWKAEKLTGKHNGGLKVKNGTVTFKDKRLLSGVVKANMTTIEDFDIESEDYRTRLENHLKSPDFFSVDSFPTAIFTLKSGSPLGKDTYLIKGDLEIKGISNPIEFKASILINEKTARATGFADLDRIKWNVRYRSAFFFPDIGDKVIYDNFVVGFDLVAERVQNEETN